MSFFKFIKTKKFFLHFTLSLITTVLLSWIGLKWISSYTKHNITVKVPDFTGKPIVALNDFIKDKQLRYQIIDSIYSPQQTPGTIIRQDPEKESEVKENRVIYLYVTSMLPPMIEMPKLVDRSVRQAIAMVESYGLKANVKYVSNSCKNCVIKQFYKGKDIEAGTRIKKGSLIELQVGKGNGDNETMALPNLVGMSFCDARTKIQASALQVGSLIADKTVHDTCEALVYRQTPASGKDREVGTGAKIDLYITADKSKVDALSEE
jgi:eukaryotic-like serine/threonine-protein kinase